ncbi:MAG: complex I NDUFA9 subunit family protein [Hyphomicrobiales bacterium]|nr:complex I NDUFA9 subunit family protein [Hyphomicrobiales bacterium]
MAVTLGPSSIVTVYGGSGFVGRYVVQALAKTGARIRVAVRRPDLANHLQPLGGVGQIHAIQANVRNAASVRRAAEGADAVVNLVAILQQGGKQTFQAVHTGGAAAVARAAKDAGARALVHVSSIGAEKMSRSGYARTKGEAEAAVLGAFPRAVILRPSVIFGAEDQFFNRFAAMARIAPALPLIGGGRTRFQPVYVGDVARAVVAAIDGRAKLGAAYELGGPQIYSFREILDKIAEYTGRRRPYVSIPFWAAKIQGAALQILPSAPITLDQVRMLESDNVVSAEAIREARTLEGLGITPQSIDAIVPGYLVRFRPKGEFSARPGAGQ